MIGTIIVIILLTIIIAICFYKTWATLDEAIILGCLFGAFIGIIISMISTIVICNVAETKITNTTYYELITINNQYWITNTKTNEKTIYFTDEGNEIQTHDITYDDVRFSQEIDKPIAIKNLCEFTNPVVKLFCKRKTEYEILIPYSETMNELNLSY